MTDFFHINKVKSNKSDDTSVSPLKFIMNKLAHAVFDFLILSFIALLPLICVYIDLVLLENSLGEISVTEITQESFLLLSAIIFWRGSWKMPSQRGFLVLAAGFLSCLFIREMDAFLDEIYHGFWFWPAIFVASSSILYARFFATNTSLKPLLSFINTKPYFMMLVGIIILLVLSRTFGSGNLLWNALLHEGHIFRFKSAIQEGLELFGYAFIFYGTLIFQHRGFISLVENDFQRD